MYRHLLVPVDGDDACIEMLGQAVEFAQSIGARITFCQSPDGLAASHGEAETDAAAQAARADLANELFARAEAAARAQGVPFSRAVPAVGAPLPSLAIVARAHGCDMIFVTPQRQALANLKSAHGDSTSGSDHGIAVLTCAIDSRPSVALAIGILLAEQRAVASLVHAARRTVRNMRASGAHHETEALREIVTSLGELQGPRHGLMTEALFARLRERTSSVDAELDELEQQHQRAAEIIRELAGLVASNQESATTGVRLEETLNVCAQFTWEHMGREEGVVLPAARRYLRDTDWDALSEAFAALSAREAPRATSDEAIG